MTDSVSTMTTTLDGSGVAFGARVITKSMLDIIQGTRAAQTALAALDSQASRFGRGGTAAMNALRGGVDHVNKASTGLRHTLKTIEERIIRIGATLAVFAGAVAAVRLIGGAFREAFEYMSLMETAMLGIASSYLVVGKYVDETTGKQLTAQKAFIAAQEDSRKAIEMLKVANLKTIATLDELVQGFQIALPVALRQGFDTKQVVDFTTAVYQMAGAIGQPFDQMSEEIRSLLGQANITKHSRMAQVLGLQAGTAIRKEFDKAKASGVELYHFMMKLVKPFEMAGLASQKTWDGLISNIKDIGKIGLGVAFGKTFTVAKDTLIEIQGIFGEIDNESLAFTINPKFLEGAREFGNILKKSFNELRSALSSDANISFIGPLLMEFKLAGKFMYGLVKSIIFVAAPLAAITTAFITFRLTLLVVKGTYGLFSAVVSAFTVSITKENLALARLGITSAAVSAQKKRSAVMDIEASAHRMAVTTLENKVIADAIAMETMRGIAFTENAKKTVILTAATVANTNANRIAAVVQKVGTAGTVYHAAALNQLSAANYKAAFAAGAHAAALEGVIAIEIKKIQTDGQAALALERYNVSLIRRGVLTTKVTAEEMINLQVSWLTSTQRYKDITLLRAHTLALRANAHALTFVGVASRVAAVGISLMGKAFKAIGGWFTVITVAIMAAMWAWEKYGNAAEKAQAKVDSSMSEADDIIQGLKEQVVQLDKAREAKEEYDAAMRSGAESVDEGISAMSFDVMTEANLATKLPKYLKMKEEVKFFSMEIRGLQEELDNTAAKYEGVVGMAANRFKNEEIAKVQKKIDFLVAIRTNISKQINEMAHIANIEAEKAGNPDYITQYGGGDKSEGVGKVQKALATFQAQLRKENLAGHKQNVKAELATTRALYEAGTIDATAYFDKKGELMKADVKLQIDFAKVEAKAVMETAEAKRVMAAVSAKHMVRTKITPTKSDQEEYFKLKTLESKEREKQNKLVAQLGEIDATIAKEKAAGIRKEIDGLAQLGKVRINLSNKQNALLIAGDRVRTKSQLAIEKDKFNNFKVAATEYHREVQRLKEEQIQGEINAAKLSLSRAQDVVADTGTLTSVKAKKELVKAEEKVIDLQIVLSNKMEKYASIGVAANIAVAKSAKDTALAYESYADAITKAVGSAKELHEMEINSIAYKDQIIALTTEIAAAQAAASTERYNAAMKALDQLKNLKEYKKSIADIDDSVAIKEAQNSVLRGIRAEQAAIELRYDAEIARIKLVMELKGTAGQDTELERALVAAAKINRDLNLQNTTDWGKWQEDAKNALADVSTLAAGMADSFKSGLGTVFEELVMDAATLKEAVQGLAEGMARSMLNALGEIAAQWLILQAVQLATGKTTQAAAVAAAAIAGPAIATAYAPAAAMVSLASFGTNSAPAMAGIGATNALSLSLAQLGLAGVAHDGIDSVPESGTWNLEKGERVITEETSAKLDKTLDAVLASKGQAAQPAQNIRIINAFDTELVGDYIGSDTGERKIMNVIKRNKTSIRQMIGGW